jgi:hypothetical protein
VSEQNAIIPNIIIIKRTSKSKAPFKKDELKILKKSLISKAFLENMA